MTKKVNQDKDSASKSRVELSNSAGAQHSIGGDDTRFVSPMGIPFPFHPPIKDDRT